MASSTISRGYDPNAEAIAHGALKDLTGFEPVLVQAIKFDEKLEAEDDPAKWLAIRNGEFDEEYAEHLGERASEDSYTSDTLIKAYVRELRKQKGWTALRDHPHLDGILYAWIDLLRQANGKCEEAEILALAEKSSRHRHEDRFWFVADICWHDSLAPKLFERIIADHDNRELRRELAVCFARRAAGSYDELIKHLLPGNGRRLLELFLDLRVAWHRKNERAEIEGFVQTTRNALPKEIAEVAAVFLENSDVVPVLEGPALDLVRSLDPRKNVGLALQKAKLLAAAGQDASDLVTALVNDSLGDTSEDIASAADALQLAAVQGRWPLIEASLTHRFADVRRVALEALAARTTVALPPNLLALASDKSSGVRRALAGILKDRRASEHMDALVILAADDWSDRQSYYGQEANYPIAQEAAEILEGLPPLPERVLEPLVEISTKTRDPDVRWSLIEAIAKNGGRNGVARVCDLAISRESVKMATAAARALFLTGDKVDEATANRLTVEQVTARNEGVSVFMAMAIGACCSRKRVMEAASVLSALPKRRALLVPLMVGATKQNETLVREVTRLLPADREAKVLDAFNDGPKLVRETLDDLGDVRIVAEILRRLSSLFVPKPK